MRARSFAQHYRLPWQEYEGLGMSATNAEAGSGGFSARVTAAAALGQGKDL
jgi:hypothetical protein